MLSSTCLKLLMTSFSSKARGSREALQKSGFFAIPIIFLVSALVFLPLLVHPALTLASEVILVLLMFIILRRATKNFARLKYIKGYPVRLDIIKIKNK